MAERGVIFKDDFVSTPGKSWFDMSFDYLFSMNFGELVPSTCMECMGGDVIHAKSDSFVRLAPLVAPTFGKANMFSYHFYVRNYSIWKGWRAFYAEGDQRESWQQSISGAFVPPEVPYLPIHKIMSALASNEYRVIPNESYATAWLNYGFSYGLIGNIITSTKLFTPALYAYYSGGEVHIEFFENIHENCTISTTNEGVLIPFAWNKYESSADVTSVLGVDIPKTVSNPFSNGSLFDYLGVDLSGHYANQFLFYKQAVAAFRTAINDTNPDIDLDYQPIANFIKSHYIYGVTYIHNNQLCSVNFAGKVEFDGSDEDHKSDVLALTFDSLYNDSKISSLPLRAYWSIYIDYFRDENYISVNPIVDFARDGEDIDWAQSYADLYDYLTLNIKSYEHDPYTTALPQAQRGKPVRFLNDSMLKLDVNSSATIPVGVKKNLNSTIAISENGVSIGTTTTNAASVSGAPVVVDLSAATIENFRFANATQKLLEKIARSGNRYYEYMRAIYGVVVDDAKIDRPIFLGGDKSPIQISEVLQTSASEVTTDQPLGQMAGRGVSVGNDDYIEYIAPDAGFFIEICCALPRTNYQQGLAPMFHRFDRLDFAIPDYAQLGEQQVPQRELWYSANESDDETPFGYQSRFYDMKYQRDRTSGSFKDSLSFWTWSRIFDEAPIAGKEFLEVRPDYRQFAVTNKNTEHIYVHMWHDIQVNRALPVFGTPKL